MVGLSWLMVETCLMAGNGSWGPFWIFLAGFSVMFALLGCWPLSDKAVNKIGAVIAVLVGVALVVVSVLGHNGVLLMAFKAIIAVVYIVFGLIAFAGSKNQSTAAH